MDNDSSGRMLDETPDVTGGIERTVDVVADDRMTLYRMSAVFWSAVLLLMGAVLYFIIGGRLGTLLLIMVILILLFFIVEYFELHIERRPWAILLEDAGLTMVFRRKRTFVPWEDITQVSVTHHVWFYRGRRPAAACMFVKKRRYRMDSAAAMEVLKAYEAKHAPLPNPTVHRRWQSVWMLDT